MDDDINSDDFDKILAKIQEESLRHYNEVELPRAAALKEQEQKKTLNVSEADLFISKVTSKDGNTSFGDTGEPLFHHGEDAEGFHYAAGKTYIYPSNYPVRRYQADIVPTALFHNTLVSLPTGLGKTFIAAVVMYNFYRWYPMGKVIFMAPTRPLVTQQLSACRDIMGIPVEDTVELTGSTHAENRKALWTSKRVFYLTPQVLMNDLRSNLLQASAIKCLVIDEAHRATKGYAYCQVVKILYEENVKFRILALSATPGTDANAVKDVIQNLHIEKLEIRSEDSEDVVEYSHQKSVIPIIVDLPAFLRDIWSQYMQVYDNYVRRIRDLKIFNQNVATMSKFQMLTAYRKFTSRPPSTLPHNVVQSLNGDFTSCITLAHGRELLQTYGLRTFHSYFTDAENSNDKAASITRLSHDKDFRNLLGTIEEIIFKEDNGDSRQYNWSHPKMEHLVSVVSEHFEMKAKDGESTKAIIFCQYRLVVTEVFEIMKKFVPLAKPVMFIGQSSKEKGQGLPQKKQIEVMKQFRSGEFNVLIATSVAEEGLDIGDVDLIVSMETHRSPIKLVQRFGRTGRKRSGRCVVLLTSGVEVRKFNEVMSTQKNYSSIISAPGVRASLEENSPRMVPQNCNPKLQLLHIKVQKLEKRKQCDIRNVFGKLDTSRTYPSTSAAAAAAPHVPKSAFLTDVELAQVRDELGSYFPNFDRLPASCELWPRQKGPRLEIEEFASDKFSRYSDWLDCNSDLQQTHVVGHSRDTNMLVHLLQKATEIRERTDRSDEPVVHDPIPSPPASLWSTVGGVNQNQKRKNEGVKKTTKTSTKNQPKSKHGLDIRECMAKVAPKIGFISQDSTIDYVSNRKNTSNLKNFQTVDEENDVIIVNDDIDRILDDVLKDFQNILGRPSYCALSRNRDIRSVALKCFSSPMKCEMNLKVVPNICKLLEGITIDDVKNLDLINLPSLKSSSLKNDLAIVDGVDSWNEVVDFHQDRIEVVDKLGGSSLNKQVDFKNAELVDNLGRSSMIKPVDMKNAESNIDLEDEDTCMSSESFIIGLDDIMKTYKTVETDTPLKDSTKHNHQLTSFNAEIIDLITPVKETENSRMSFEEKDLSPILSQRSKPKVVKTEKSNNFSNVNWENKNGDIGGGFLVDENELSPILSQRPMKKKSKCVDGNNSVKGNFGRGEEMEEYCRFGEMNLSPILSQRPQKKNSKHVQGKISNQFMKDNFGKDEVFKFEGVNISPDLSQRPKKISKVTETVRNDINGVENFQFDGNELSPILSQRPPKKKSKGLEGNTLNKVTEGNSGIHEKGFNLSSNFTKIRNKVEEDAKEGFKRKLDVESIAPLSKLLKNEVKGSENNFDDHQDFDTAFMDEFDEDMLAQLSPILSSKTFKKPEDRKVIIDNKNGVVDLELSPILSQSRKKSSKTSGIKVGGYSGVPKSSSTPKCIKKDLFQDRFQSLSKPNHRLSSVEEVGVCSKGDQFEGNLEDSEDFEGIVGLDEILAQSKCDEVLAKSNVVENQEDIDDDFEGIVGLDEILAQSKFDEENDIADPERSPSPKTLSYYYTGDNLYNVSQLVEIAMRLRAQGKEMNKKNIAEVRRTYDIEIGRNVEKGKQKTDGKSENNIEEEKQKSDKFILNSSDDDLFDCADSKIDFNFEAMKSPESVKHENVSINDCEQSVNLLMNDSKQSVNESNQSVNDSKPSADETNQSVVAKPSVDESNQRVNDFMKSIPDNNSKSTNSKNDPNENNLEKSQEPLDNDEDYFEITGLDELMQNCFDNKSNNPENSKSNQIVSKPPVQSKVRSELEIDSEEDELIQNCVNDALMNSFENIEAQAVSSKPAVQTENLNTLKYESESCQSKYFSSGLTSGTKLVNYKETSRDVTNTAVVNSKLQSENSKSNKEGIVKQVTEDDPSNTVNQRSTSETVANTVVSGKLNPENGKFDKKEAVTPITNPPNKPLCSTQFKSDYLSNEELEELLKSGMFSDTPVEVSAAKPETSIDVLDLTENDPDIIDNSNELHMESPLILSYGNRSAKVAGSITRNRSKNDNSLQNSSKFSLLSKSKSKGGLSLGKGTQSKLNFASGSKEKGFGEFSGGKRTDIGSRNDEKDEILSLGAPVVRLTRLESMGTTVNTSDEKISGEFSVMEETRKENLRKQESSCSWELPDLKETRHFAKDNNKLKLENSGKRSSVVSPVVKCIRLDNIGTDLKNSDDSFSWGSSDTLKVSAQKIKHDTSFSSQSSDKRLTVNESGQKIKHDTSSSCRSSETVKISAQKIKHDTSLSCRSLDRPTVNECGRKITHDTSSSCRSSDTVKILGNEAKHNELDGQTCLGVEKDGKTRSLEDSFSWETRETRGCGGENIDEKSCEKKSSVIEISDDSFYPGERHRQQRKPLVISSGSDQEEEDIFPTISTAKQCKFGGKIDRPSTSSVSRKSTSFKANNSSDTDDSSDIFITSVNKPADKSLNDSEAVPSRRKGGKSKKAKNKKPNAFIEIEADVSGDETSSGRETSGLDSMDESFVDDQVNNDNTMMVAHYLQTVKTPTKVAGGYRIPELSESVMARDVYSQYVPMEHETYVNDSFCVGNETGTNESEMSELELAEKLLAKRKKDRKHKKKAKRKRKKSSSESVASSSQESRRNEQIEGKKEERKKKKKKRRIVILDDSSD